MIKLQITHGALGAKSALNVLDIPAIEGDGRLNNYFMLNFYSKVKKLVVMDVPIPGLEIAFEFKIAI